MLRVKEQTDEGLVRELLATPGTTWANIDQKIAVLLARVRLDEAKWWCHVFNNNEPYKWVAIGDERIAALEAAVKESQHADNRSSQA